MALGAQRSTVLGMVMREGMLLTLVGALGGLIGALLLTRVMTKLLYGVKPTDAATYATVAAVLCAVALAACWLPARRATRVDPIIALRSE
jgi:ABC-type antimicrobial peptide transport system permease subunit